MIVLVHILLLLGLSVVQSTFTSPADVRSSIKIDRIEDYEDLYVAAKLSIDVFFRDSEIEQSRSDSNIFGFFQKSNREVRTLAFFFAVTCISLLPLFCIVILTQ